MKRVLYKWSNVLASFFALVAIIGVRPNCTFIFYEPEVPEELMR